MSELTELIEIAKNIEKQNDEIIRLLRKIADEKESENKPIIDLGELYLSDDKGVLISGFSFEIKKLFNLL